MSFAFDIRRKVFYENIKLESCSWKWRCVVVVSFTPAGKSIFSCRHSHFVTKRFIILHGEGRQLRGPLFSQGAMEGNGGIWFLLAGIGRHTYRCPHFIGKVTDICPLAGPQDFKLVLGGVAWSKVIICCDTQRACGWCDHIPDWVWRLSDLVNVKPVLLLQFHVRQSCDKQSGKVDQEPSTSGCRILQLHISSHQISKLFFLFRFSATDTLHSLHFHSL